MEVTVSEHAGFCFGVRRSLSLLDDAIKMYGDVYLYGSIVHNKIVMEHYLGMGVKVAARAEDIPSFSTVVIRAHGIGRCERESLVKRGVRIIDTTCPFVGLNITDAMKSEKEVLLIGLRGHDEVSSIALNARNGVHIIQNREELLDIDLKKDYTVIVQTTFPEKELDGILKVLASYGLSPERKVCLSSVRQREEIRRLASSYDVLLVVGDRSSANTRALYEEGLSAGKCSFLIESRKDLDSLTLRGRVFITAGTSTPPDVVMDVKRGVESL